MKINKKCICALLVCLMMLSTSAFAQEPVKQAESVDKLAESDIGQGALEFMRKSQNDALIEIDCIQPYYDCEGNKTAYCVSFNSGNKQAGYVLISLITYGNPIVEFAFEGHGPNAYVETHTLSEKIQNDKQNNFIYLGPDSFFYRQSDNNFISLFSGQKVNTELIEKTYKEYKNFVSNKWNELNSQKSLNKASSGTIDDGIIDWGDAAVNTDSVFKIDSFGSGSDYWLMNDFKKNAGVCAPTAATNIVWYWAMKRNSSVACEPIKNISGNRAKALSIFNTMYKGMRTSDKYGTIDTSVPNGYNNYFVNQEGRWNYKFLSAKSSYEDFKNALNDNCPVHLQLRMSSHAWESEGHDVFAFGYASSTSGTQYIFVMDGWNTYGRFVKFTYFPVTKGYKIWVS